MNTNRGRSTFGGNNRFKKGGFKSKEGRRDNGRYQRRGGGRGRGRERGKNSRGGRNGGFRGGNKVVVQPHQHEGVFYLQDKNDAILTKSLFPGESVYNEKRVTVE